MFNTVYKIFFLGFVQYSCRIPPKIGLIICLWEFLRKFLRISLRNSSRHLWISSAVFFVKFLHIFSRSCKGFVGDFFQRYFQKFIRKLFRKLPHFYRDFLKEFFLDILKTFLGELIQGFFREYHQRFSGNFSGPVYQKSLVKNGYFNRNSIE